MEELHKMYDKRAEYYENPREEMLVFLPAHTKKLLDIGCGKGPFGELVKRRFDAEVWGMDIDKQSVEVAAKRLNRVIYGDINQMLKDVPDGYFDVITFNDVLEHMIDPYSLLSNIKSKLNRNGVIISSIPNIRYFRVLLKLLYKKEWKYEQSGILDKTHMRFFTRKSIYEMYQSAGYEVVRMEGLFPTKSIKPLLMNIITFGAFSEDCRYVQYATIAKPLETNISVK